VEEEMKKKIEEEKEEIWETEGDGAAVNKGREKEQAR
jgi:hypothetical protein